MLNSNGLANEHLKNIGFYNTHCPPLTANSVPEAHNPVQGSNDTANGILLSPCDPACPCEFGKPICSYACEKAKSFKFPETCGKCIDRLHTMLHASASELFVLRTENADLKQLLESKKKALNVFQKQLNQLNSTGNVTGVGIDSVDSELQQQNERLSSELALVQGRLASSRKSWEDCFKRLRDENEQLRKAVSELQLALKELKYGLQGKDEVNQTNLQKSDASSKQQFEDQLLPVCLNNLSDGSRCSHSIQIDSLRRRIEELKANERYQRDRADDLNISLEAYKMALERQFSESRNFVTRFVKALENLPSAKDKPSEVDDADIRSDLTQWIEQAVESALKENEERGSRLKGAPLQKSTCSSSSSCPIIPLSYYQEAGVPNKPYRKNPVNSRSRGRKATLRLQTLYKTLDIIHGTATTVTKKVSPLETLLLMVNEILEKLTEGRMEEYIHTERFKLLSEKNLKQKRVAMVTTII